MFSVRKIRIIVASKQHFHLRLLSIDLTHYRVLFFSCRSHEGNLQALDSDSSRCVSFVSILASTKINHTLIVVLLANNSAYLFHSAYTRLQFHLNSWRSQVEVNRRATLLRCKWNLINGATTSSRFIARGVSPRWCFDPSIRCLASLI